MGPKNLDEIYDWPWQGVLAVADRAEATGLDIFGCLKKAAGTVIITSCYSGMGCAEAALQLVAAALQDVGGATLDFKAYSACDIDPVCRHMLLNHVAHSQADHVFGDILERLDPGVRKNLEQKGDRLRKLLQLRLQHANSAGHTTTRVAEIKSEQVQRLGAKYTQAICAALQQSPLDPDRLCWCYRHNRYCCPTPPAVAAGAEVDVVSPGGLRCEGSTGRSTASGNRAVRVEVAGTTCVAWSSMGDGLGWLHPSSLPCLTWCYWQLATGPDLVLHECTRTFDSDLLRDILGSKYHVESLVSSPNDVGIPCQRHRKYTLCRRKSEAEQAAACGCGPCGSGACSSGGSGSAAAATSEARPPQAFRYCKRTFAELFHRRTVLDGRVYLTAPRDRLAEYAKEMACKRFLAPLPGDQQREFQDILPPSHRVRLRGYEELARSQGCSGAQIVNLTQTPGHMQQVSQLVPALLRTSALYSMGAQRPFHPEELFQVQGIPVPHLLPPESRHARYYPFRRSLRELASETAMRSLTGNSMHLAQVGLALLLSLVEYAEKACQDG